MRDFIVRVRQLGRHVVHACVGEVQWQPPGWARAAYAYRTRIALVLLSALAVVGGVRYVRTHRKPRPQPHLVHASIIAPGVPALADRIVPADLVVRFDASAAALGRVNQPVPAGLVRLEPAHPGEWRWSGDRQLSFSTKQEWPAAQTYRVTIDPAALAPNLRLDEYRLETRTPEFAARLMEVEFYQNPKDLAQKQVTATLLFTHAVNPAEIERRLSVTMLGGSPVFGPQTSKLIAVTPGRHGREWFLRTVPLTLPKTADTMKLRLEAGVPAAQGDARTPLEKSATVAVPDLYSFFKIKGVETRIVKDKDGNSDQVLFIETSCAARSEDLAKALEMYVLPKVNPSRHTEKADASDDASNGDTETDADDEDNDSEPPGNHDGRYHDDNDNHTQEGLEKAEAADSPTRIDDWSPSEVGDAALKHARRVPLTLIPSMDASSTAHTFRFRENLPGRLFVQIAKDVPAPGGYRLHDDYEDVIPVPIPDKEIVIQGDGGVLALSGQRKLSIQSRGVPAIRYEIARVPAAEINHLASQTEGNFQQPEFINRHFNEQDLARFTAETQGINVHNPVQANYSTFDFTSHLQPTAGLDREGLFFLTASAWDPKTNKYIEGVSASRFVLVTDLGLLVKRNGDGSRDAFVASLAGGGALGAVEVSILARNGATLASAPTDAEGRARLPSLGKNPRDSREPVAIVARRGGDVAFLPYERSDRTLDFSRFPVEGIESKTGSELGAFVFSERGVYRPGDTLHVGVVVKQHDWKGSLAGLPLETEVIDAREQSAQVRPLVLPASGFAEWNYDTAADSPTGGYSLNVYLLRNGKRSTLLGSTTVQVKEFLPDRIKLDVALSKTSGPAGHGWVTPEDLRGSIALKNLYGAAASDRLIKAHLRLNPRALAFKEFPDFTFYDRLRDGRKDWEGDTIELGDQKTDADGKATFEFDLKRFADVTYRLTFDAEGFEAEGGRSVEDLTGALVSPLPYVVGWRADGDLNWITAGGPGRTLEFIAIDRALNRLPLTGITLHLAEQQYVSVLTKGENGNYHYESVRRERPISDEPTAVPAEGWKYALRNETPGNYLVELRDAAGQAISRLEYTVVGQGRVTRSLEKNAELEIKLSKEQYRAGEEIEVAITAPYAGSGLITIERERVYTHRWFQSTGVSSVQKITIPADFDGTGYVNVSFVRALDSKEIFMSPLSYAAAPFTANMEQRRMKIDLRAAEKTKPGEPLAIRYHTDRPAKIAVFAVDQGILQVTRFPLPDPLAYQFRKSALNVRTSQIVDLLLPEFSLLRAAQSTGGDGDPGVLNPFRRVTEKPVVYWSGIVDSDTTERTLTYNVPDYFSGTLTIMAVAVSAEAVGSVKTETLCRNAFVLTPGVPTLAAPGDEFEVGLTVANGQLGSGPNAQVTVLAEPGDGVQLIRGLTGPLTIPEGREVSTAFRFRALDHLGSAQVGFSAQSGGESSRVHATLSIRPAMPFRTLVTSGHFDGTKETPVAATSYYAECRRLEATISALPIGLARGLERYLKEYPHGCSEQITSDAFARMALAGMPEFGLTRAEAAEQIEHTIGIERRRQNDQGGFGFWDSSKTPDIDFITVYVMHFLSEAKADGYPVPDDLFQKGLHALERTAAASPWNLQQARVQAYALYVLTREGVVTTNHLLTLRDYLDTYYKLKWQGDLTGVYLAGCWSLLKKEDEANRLISAYKPGVFDAREFWDFCGPLTADAQYITMLARHFPDRLRKVSAREFECVTRPIGDGEFSTLSAAYAVLALKAYSQAVAQNPPHLSAGALLGPKAKETPLVLAGKNTAFLRGTFPVQATALRFHTDGGSAFYQTTQSGFDRTLPAAPFAKGIEVFRELLDAEGKHPVDHVRMGERLTVRLRLRATHSWTVTNVAIIDLLPGGFEIADDSLKPGVGVAGMDYVDVREDRVVLYGTATGQTREITYRIKPTSRGAFTVPPVFAESMYDKKVQSLGMGGHVTVTEAK